MTQDDFDKCPTCGGFGIYGLRCHPKFATVYEGLDEESYPEMRMAYFHEKRHNDDFARRHKENRTLLYVQRWVAGSSETGWTEYEL